MSWKWGGVILGVIAAAFCLEFLFSSLTKPKTKEKPVEVKWEQLYKLNYETGEYPEELKVLNGKRVKIAGFVVPLSDNYSVFDEFLVVPDAQSCVHSPPPPPNLIIQSKMVTPLSSDKVFNPAWVTGILKIEKVESKFGAAGYQMKVEKLEEYVY